MAGYCTTSNVSTWTQTAYDGSSRPTSTDVQAFVDQRAGEIHAWLTEVLGGSAPGPGAAGYSITIDTSTDRGKTLDRVCLMGNAIGAGIDALTAAGIGEASARSERVEELIVLYYGQDGDRGVKESIKAAAKAYGQIASIEAATHYSEGVVTQRSLEGREEGEPAFTHETEW